MMATVFDVFGFVLLAVMVRSGLKKGLIDGVLKIVGMYAAMYASMNYNQFGMIILEPLIDVPEHYQTIAGYATVFLVVMYSISFISFLLRRLVISMHLGVVDKIGGITLGVAKAGLLLSAVVWAYTLVPKDMKGDWQQRSILYPHVELFAGYAVNILSLEDELILMQSTMGSFMGGSQDKLLESVLGGAGSANTPDIQSLLGGGGDLTESPIFKNALESLEGPQKEIIEKALEAMQTGNANSLLEGAIRSKDDSGNSLMDDAMKYMDPAQKSDLHAKIMELEKEIKAQQAKDNE